MPRVRKHLLSTPNALEHGLSLVELLVAMAVGLLLTAGVLTIFVNSRQTYRVQDNLSRLQENGRFALTLVGNALRMTGFKTDPATPNTSVFPTGAISGTETTGSPDSITVSFQGASDGTTRDCLGNPVPASGTVGTQFSIVANNLRCTSTTSATPQPLIENVEDMQITYGIDSDGSRSPNYFVPAGSVAISDWSKVVSLHISLLLRTQEDNLTTTQQTYQYNGATTTAADGRLREVVSTTIALRNLLP
jgi:type IV pilus assembly protein PilW